MRLLRYNTNLKRRSCGKITLDEAYKELERILLRGGEVFNNENIAISATSFALARSDKDVIELSCHSVDEVYFSSDRAKYKLNLLNKLLAQPRIQLRASSETSKQIMSDYFELSRHTFEEKYRSGYTSRQSLTYCLID